MVKGVVDEEAVRVEQLVLEDHRDIELPEGPAVESGHAPREPQGSRVQILLPSE